MSKTLVVLREAAAGAATACVALPLAVASGILVYSQFGAEFLALGAIAGLVTVIGGGALASLFYGSLLVKSLPAKSALIQSSIAGAMVASIGDIRVVMVALPFCIMLASAWQIGLALSGLSKIVNMTPYPVVAGFASGVGLLIIFGQLPTLLGVPSILDVAQAGNLSVSRLLFGAGVISAMFALNRATPHIPAPVIGLIVGYAIYHLVGFFAPGTDIGPVVGAIDVALRVPFDISSLTALVSAGDGPKIWLILLGGSLVLALAGTLDTAVAIESLRRMANVPTNEKRDLTGQGVASMIVAAGGGLYVTTSIVLTAANYHAGGRTRWSPFLGAAFLFLGGCAFSRDRFFATNRRSVGNPGLRRFQADRSLGCRRLSPGGLLRRFPCPGAGSPQCDDRRRGHVLTVLGQPLVGAAVGAVLACAVFVAQMSRPAVRNKVIAKRLRSKRRRSSAHEALLAENSIKLAVLQLQGVLFFGNANDIRLEIDSLPEAVETLILDFHDVTDIDLSGSLALSQACTGLRNQRRQVLFSSLRNPQVEPAIREMASDTEVFVDLDAALERFEEEILRRTPGATGSRLEMKLVDSDFGRQMTPEELSALTRHLQHVVFPSGAALCRAGDPSDRLWVLTRGCVSVWAPTESGPIRLESICAGCMVGEMGLLDERPRSADVFADEEVHAYELTADAFRTVLSECPQLGQAVVKTIARELAERVRITSRELQHANQ